MTTTRQQDNDFAREVLDPASVLEKAIDWIRGNLQPEDVFNEDALKNWATESGFVEGDE